MAEVKLVVVYPMPRDVEGFERVYREEHLPMAAAKLTGASKAVITKIIGTPDGSTPPFHRIAEIYFPSMEALQSCAASEGARETVAHAVSISDGGPPLFMIAETEILPMDGTAKP